MYSAGTVLRLDFTTFFHYGIADGTGFVIHNSKKYKKVIRENYEDFAEGREMQISDISSETPTQAAINASGYINMPYNLLRSNCEHFVRLCHGLDVESKQVQQWLILALGTGAALKGNNTYIRAAGGAAALASLLTPSEGQPFKNSMIAGFVALGLVRILS